MMVRNATQHPIIRGSLRYQYVRIEDFIAQHSCTAHEKRRTDIMVLSPACARNGEGFRLIELQELLYKSVPGLFKLGMSVDAVGHLFSAPSTNLKAALKYRGVIKAQRGQKKNNWRELTEGTHYARAEQKLITEFMASFNQLNLSGDDMNIVQVGRPAVSRYHQIKGFYPTGEGPNLAVHDFPNSKYAYVLRYTGGSWYEAGIVSAALVEQNISTEIFIYRTRRTYDDPKYVQNVTVEPNI